MSTIFILHIFSLIFIYHFDDSETVQKNSPCLIPLSPCFTRKQVRLPLRQPFSLFPSDILPGSGGKSIMTDLMHGAKFVNFLTSKFISRGTLLPHPCARPDKRDRRLEQIQTTVSSKIHKQKQFIQRRGNGPPPFAKTPVRGFSCRLTPPGELRPRL